MAVADWNKDSLGKYQYRKTDGLNAVNEWLTINHHWYLFGKDGCMLTGWQRWNGSSVVSATEAGDWYYLDNTASGALEGACWHEVKERNGACVIVSYLYTTLMWRIFAMQQ